MVAAPCIVLVLLALVSRALEARRGLPAARLVAWPFFVAPPAIFTLQEHLERLGQNILGERVFWVGLLLQVLIGFVAWLAARLLLRVASIVGRRLRSHGSRPGPSRLPVPALVSLKRLSLLAAGHAQRGPPAALLVG